MSMTSYYDIVLALIPLTLVGTTVVLFGAGLSVTTAVPIGAALSVLLIGHAMFMRAPVSAPSSAGASEVSAQGVADITAD